MLHAAELRLPVDDGEPMAIRADLPADFESVLDGLR
jgi:hypothetical protein